MKKQHTGFTWVWSPLIAATFIALVVANFINPNLCLLLVTILIGDLLWVKK